jgi:cholesterol oxidase
MANGSNIVLRIMNLVGDLIRHPIQNLKSYFVWDWARHTQILMFMQTINSTLRFRKSRTGLKSSMEEGPAPTAFIPEAKKLALEYAKIVKGKPGGLITEVLMGRPTTAHILGGAVMGKSANEGVIDKDNRVFNYRNMYICDGSMISANPGVNPSLTITALSERAMSNIPARK